MWRQLLRREYWCQEDIDSDLIMDKEKNHLDSMNKVKAVSAGKPFAVAVHLSVMWTIWKNISRSDAESSEGRSAETVQIQTVQMKYIPRRS